jgi:hypothetical protein
MNINAMQPCAPRNVRLVWTALFATAALQILPACERATDPAPTAPGGGSRYVLDYPTFASQIEPMLTAKGCDDLNCHGGGIRGTFELSPAGDKDVALDFAQASLQVTGDNPPQSPLISKPLDPNAGGSVHGGGVFFVDTDDADYQALLAWIEAGDYE